MNTQEIIKSITALIDCEKYSPGQAFDALLDLRREKITPNDIAKAFGGSFTLQPDEPKKAFVEPPTGPVTDDTVCWFGKFRGVRMGDIDIGYFQWLWKQRPLKDQRMEPYVKKRLNIGKPDPEEAVPSTPETLSPGKVPF